MSPLNTRFECELPQTERQRFNIPKQRRPAKIRWWPILAFGGLALAFWIEARHSAPPAPQPVLQATQVAPRAQAVVPRAAPVIGQTYRLRMPDGAIVNATFRGYRDNADQLPIRGGTQGDMYGIGPALWILTTPLAGGRVSWIDP